MIVRKRTELKRMTKITTLAELCNISPITLSRIINNHIKPSQELAHRLAENANKLCLTEDYFKPEDFIPQSIKDEQ